MKWSIFSRLVTGYLAIFVLVLAIGLYAVMQLRHYNTVTRTILGVNNVVIDYEKKIGDSLLSQIRYERKYLIIKDKSLYVQFTAAKNDFIRYADAILALADTPRKQAFIRKISSYHKRYQDLFAREVEYLTAGEPYEQDRFRQEKGKAVEAALEEMKAMRAHCQQDSYEKILMLRERSDHARTIGVTIAAVTLPLAIIVAFTITRSITRPLSLVIAKTREIEEGVLKDDLSISSPPELGELAKAFNAMCSKLKRVDKMKSDFFSCMSHELRTPLTSIKEGTNLLLEGVGGEASERQRKLLTIISQESDRMIGMVNSVMDLSKMEAGMMEFTYTMEDIRPLIARAVEEAGLLAEAKGIELLVEEIPGIPEVRVDRERILQVLRNLIGNAVKFTLHGGKVTISAGPVTGNLMVVVTDTGPGIAKEYLGTIFDKFQQVPQTDAYRIKGSGLGLALVKHIITAHGGKVWVESEPGKGSSFIFILPV
ncbi:MAG: HAMP domain-containing protein [Alphaproteobacteria bacterium]|uniref:histidine kinase n=1 Tax=Candidatus Nitrobium versatile TaxID=2884831 RepID=A0A953J594_9BACT|nr:HAMP domain-containing protein [Candidatus Nitrobium versatile]